MQELYIPLKNHTEFCKKNWGIGAVYCIRNTKNLKCYIGSSVGVGNRIRSHYNYLLRGDHHNNYLQNAFNKNGVDCFEFFVVGYENDERKLRELEQKSSMEYQVFDEKKGYNLRIDGADDHFLTSSGLKQVQDSNYNKLRKRVVRINVKTPNIKIYDSVREARLEHKSAVGSVLSGRTRMTNYGKYIWMYYTDFMKCGKISEIIDKIPKRIKNINLLVLDTQTGIYYDSIFEASEAKGVPTPRLYKTEKDKIHNSGLIILNKNKND